MIARQHAGRQPTPYLLPTYSRPTNHYLLPTYSSLPTPYLPITTYSLPTPYYSLPTTYLLPTLEPALRTFSLVDLEVPDIEKFVCSNQDDQVNIDLCGQRCVNSFSVQRLYLLASMLASKMRAQQR